MAPKKKFNNIKTDLLADFIRKEGYPPRNASCVNGGYWVRATKHCCNVKEPSKRLCLAVRHHWHRNICGLKEKV